VEALILTQLERLEKEGFTSTAIEAAMNTTEFSLRENNTGSFPRGLSLMLRAMAPWIYDKDPFQPLRWTDDLAHFKVGRCTTPMCASCSAGAAGRWWRAALRLRSMLLSAKPGWRSKGLHPMGGVSWPGLPIAAERNARCARGLLQHLPFQHGARGACGRRVWRQARTCLARSSAASSWTTSTASPWRCGCGHACVRSCGDVLLGAPASAQA